MTLILAIAESALRASTFALVVGVGLTVLRVRRTSVHLFAWTLVLYVALAMPVLAAIVPRFVVAVPVVASRLDSATSDARDIDGTTTGPSASRMSAIADRTPDDSSRLPTLARLVVFITYSAGVFVLLLRALTGWSISRRLERSSTAISDATITERLNAHARTLGLSGPPALLESPRITVPVTTGVSKPRVVLPATWRTWPAETLEAVLVHEISHVGRRDALTQRLSLLHRAVMWPNPLSWWLHRRLAALAEQASDEAALSAGIAQTSYAETLLGFFALRQADRWHRGSWHVAMARGADKQAEQRVERILNWKGGQSMTLTTSAAFALVLASAPIVGLTAAVHLDRFEVVRPDVAAIAKGPLAVMLPLKSNALPTIDALQPAAAPSVATRSAGLAVATQNKGALTLKNLAFWPDEVGRPRSADAKTGPITLVEAFTNVRDGAFITPLVRNDSDKAVRGLHVVVLGQSGRRYQGMGKGFVLAALLQPAESRRLDLDLIRPATVDFLAKASEATLFVFMVDFADGSKWTAPGTSSDADLFSNTQDRTYPEDTPGLTPPTPVHRVEAKYTSDAMRAKIQGSVEVEIAVLVDGTVGDTRIKKSLDKTYGLDSEAVKAAKQWTFSPAKLDGKAVKALTTITIEFRLH